jgi:aspartate carbamoyltransferase catalytic subunit
VKLLSRKVDCAVINAGDGTHEHPTQACSTRSPSAAARATLAACVVAICGDILHSRVARSNIAC